MSIHQRFKQVLLLTAPTEKRNKWLEDQTGVPASKWTQLLLGRQKCTPEMLEAFCQRWPEYAEWLMTGDVLAKQESPMAVSTEELLDGAMQKVKAASSKEEFEQASKGLAKAVAFAAAVKKSEGSGDGNRQRDEVPELGAEFFANAALARPGDSLLEVVQRRHGEEPASAQDDNSQIEPRNKP